MTAFFFHVKENQTDKLNVATYERCFFKTVDSESQDYDVWFCCIATNHSNSASPVDLFIASQNNRSDRKSCVNKMFEELHYVNLLWSMNCFSRQDLDFTSVRTHLLATRIQNINQKIFSPTSLRCHFNAFW